VEDLAGLGIVLTIAASAVLAAYEAIRRFIHPQAVTHLGAIVAASLIGFAGNEAVAIFRIRVGKRIGSAALIADGYHARTDGWTSLVVLLGAVGVRFGYAIADPIAGLVITVVILGVVWGSVKTVFSRMLDGVEPEVIDHVEGVARDVPGVTGVSEVRARWLGHRLRAEVNISVEPELTVSAAHEVAKEVEHELQHHLRFLSGAIIHVDPATDAGEAKHQRGPHAHDNLPMHSH
jgi:cation diffusion facilitator family transporter